jgi:site-specific DNA-methyltransferase (adenine-specific)
MQDMPTTSVDLVVTDPPYITNYRDRNGRTVHNDDNASWLNEAFLQVYRLLKPDSFCVSFYGWPKAEKFLQVWKSVGLRPVGHLVWRKGYHSKERFVRYYHEQAYLLAKGEPKPQIVLPDVLDWKYTGNDLHPTQKPLVAILPLIMAYSSIGDIVLDPFIGSGTTAVAAQLLNRNYIGIDISEKYCRVAQERLKYRQRSNTSQVIIVNKTYMPKHFSVMSKKVIEGREKPVWLRVGTITEFENGNQVLELNLLPNQQFYIFPQDEKEEKQN